MDCRAGEAEAAVEMPASASGDALLLATVSSVGLPVEVKVKDGSLYSGVFHTASFDEGYGVVLKKAMMIEKGRCYSDLEVGDLVDTLVVLSNDLVQVIVKDFFFPMEGDNCYSIGDHLREEMEAVDPSCTDATSGIFGSNGKNNFVDFCKGVNTHNTHHVKKLFESLDNNHNDLGGRDGGVCMEEIEQQCNRPVVSVPNRQIEKTDVHAQENSGSIFEVVSSTNTVAYDDHYSSSCSVCPQQGMSIKENQDILAFKQSASEDKECNHPICLPTWPEGCKSTSEMSVEIPTSNDQVSNISTSSSTLSSDCNSTCSNLSASPNVPVPEGNTFNNTCTKEFRLNPEAKLFFPSFVNARSTSAAMPNIVNTSYLSSIHPVLPVAAAQPNFEISSFPSSTPLPTKFVQYNSLAAGQIGINTQYSRPISGQVNTRQQPARVFGQYHPAVQTGSTYMHQQAQPVMVGRAHQLVYVHPFSQDPILGATVLSQGFPVFTPCQANLPKFEGSPAQPLQFSMNSPFMAAGPMQPFAMPGPTQFSPVPAIRPIAVPGGNGFYGGKYQ